MHTSTRSSKVILHGSEKEGQLSFWSTSSDSWETHITKYPLVKEQRSTFICQHQTVHLKTEQEFRLSTSNAEKRSQLRDSLQSSFPQNTDLKALRSLTTQTCTSLHSPTAATVSPGWCCLPGQCPSECTSALPLWASEWWVILCSVHWEPRANPTWCDICEGRQIIYMTLPLTGAAILI